MGRSLPSERNHHHYHNDPSSSSNPGAQQVCLNDRREYFRHVSSQNPAGFDHRQYIRVRCRVRRIRELRFGVLALDMCGDRLSLETLWSSCISQENSVFWHGRDTSKDSAPTTGRSQPSTTEGRHGELHTECYQHQLLCLRHNRPEMISAAEDRKALEWRCWPFRAAPSSPPRGRRGLVAPLVGHAGSCPATGRRQHGTGRLGQCRSTRARSAAGSRPAPGSVKGQPPCRRKRGVKTKKTSRTSPQFKRGRVRSPIASQTNSLAGTPGTPQAANASVQPEPRYSNPHCKG